MDLNKSIVMFPYKEPSQTLYNMMQYLLQVQVRSLQTQLNKLLSEGANYGPVGTTMALLEASSKFFSANT